MTSPHRGSPGPLPSGHPGDEPVVRVVTINYDGGDMTLRCLASLLALDWPADRLQVVMVDNASVDGLARRVARLHPEVRVIDSLVNEGFARGNNLAMTDLDGVDVVALVNNDATVEPGWLRAMVPPLMADPLVGATCSKMLFTDRAVGVQVATTAAPLRTKAGRGRTVGVRLSDVHLDERTAWGDLDADEGFHGAEAGQVGEPGTRWSRQRGELRLWRPAAGDVALTARRRARGAVAGPPPVPAEVALRLSAPEPRVVSLRSGDAHVEATVGPEPTWVRIALDATEHDVVNNAGSVLYADGSAGDRGFLERDGGQYDQPAEVFGWCGGAVALRTDYLRDVGLFDPRYFLYYEDTDLSWRGRVLGWRYRYVPEAVVRHHHAASSGEGSDTFRYWVDRNRLLTLLKVAPVPMLARALGRYVDITVRQWCGEVLRPLARGRIGHARSSRIRLRVLREVAALAPAMWRERKVLQARQVVPLRAVARWAVPTR